MQEKQCLLTLRIDVNIAYKYSGSVCLLTCAAIANQKVARTEVDINLLILSAVDCRTSDNPLWVPTGIKLDS